MDMRILSDVSIDAERRLSDFGHHCGVCQHTFCRYYLKYYPPTICLQHVCYTPIGGIVFNSICKNNRFS